MLSRHTSIPHHSMSLFDLPIEITNIDDMTLCTCFLCLNLFFLLFEFFFITICDFINFMLKNLSQMVFEYLFSSNILSNDSKSKKKKNNNNNNNFYQMNYLIISFFVCCFFCMTSQFMFNFWCLKVHQNRQLLVDALNTILVSLSN